MRSACSACNFKRLHDTDEVFRSWLEKVVKSFTLDRLEAIVAKSEELSGEMPHCVKSVKSVLDEFIVMPSQAAKDIPLWIDGRIPQCPHLFTSGRNEPIPGCPTIDKGDLPNKVSMKRESRNGLMFSASPARGLGQKKATTSHRIVPTLVKLASAMFFYNKV
eukprot:GHVU01181730.1.p1 GENE.GHVU01181730.1~~GHVU01181730.1.p1  ORF type:complete len:162 (+),score=17.89 GHVU01181730.1:2129-2614(+)